MSVYDVGGDGRSVTVLVADDNDVARRLYRRVLEKAGYKVFTASEGQEAVALALAHSPDMILLDIAMPGMDCLEAMRQIRLQRPNSPIVIASAHLLPSDRARCLALGAVDMLIPPMRLADLLAVVARVTANARRQTKDVSGVGLGSYKTVGGDRIQSPPAVSAPAPPPPLVSPDGKFYWDGTWAPIPRQARPGDMSPDGKYYWDGERWVPEALMAEEGFARSARSPETPRFFWDGRRWVPEALAPTEATVTGVPFPEQPRDLDRLAADLEAVWKQVESGQLALGELDADMYSLFETLIAGLRAPRAGNGSGPSPLTLAVRRAKHRPVLQTVLGRKYEDDEGVAVAAWDGRVRLVCRCGWKASTIEAASTGALSDAWREHVTADMAGADYPG